MYSPICLFTYNRLDVLKKTVGALQNNFLSKESNLFIFSDGPKDDNDYKKIKEIREYLYSIDGFKSIQIIESNNNIGLKNSIIQGVSKIINKYHSVIVLEDDLVTSRIFLTFMNQAINYYKDYNKVFSISGFSLYLPELEKLSDDYYFGYRASSWGWGTWLDRWKEIDWDIKDYSHFKFSILDQIKFMRGGSDMPFMLRNSMNGNIDSWAIRWCYNQFRQNTYTLFPKKSKVINIGHGENATHTKNKKDYEVDFDLENKTNFLFSDEIILNKRLNKEFRAKFSIYNRLKNRLISYVKK